jgi:uncharacterized phage-associated protein
MELVREMELLDNNTLTVITPTRLAEYIVSKRGSMTPLKIQKLAYYCESYHLAYFEKSLINSDFQAWAHGPVNRDIFDMFDGRYGMYDIVSIKDSAFSGCDIKLSDSQISLLDDVLVAYGDESSYDLECRTHSELPWIEARIGIPNGSSANTIIKKETMQSFYKQFIS